MKIRRILCVLLAAMFLLTAFVGCDNKTGGNENNDQNNQQNNEQNNDQNDTNNTTPPPAGDEGNGGDENTDGTQNGEGGEGGEGGDGSGEEVKIPASEYKVNMITYNIAYYESTDSQMKVGYTGQTAADYTIAKRQLRLKALVEHYKPDVLALQEVNHIWWEYLITDEDSLLNKMGYEYEGNKSGMGNSDGFGSTDNELYNLLFWNPERFELVKGGVFYLTSSGRKTESGANRSRMCTYAILKNKATGNETVYASTHLCTTGTDSDGDLNLKQAKALKQHLEGRAEGRPIVVGGDFNMHAQSDTSAETYEYMIGAGGFFDGKTKAKVRLGVSNSSYRSWGTNTGWKNGSQIDYIFFKGEDIQLLKWSLLTDCFSPDNKVAGAAFVGDYYDLSDHLGIFVTVNELNKG